MSENTIAASRSNLRNGCSVTSAASSGVRQRSRNEATLLLTCGLFVLVGWTGVSYKAMALTTAALVCVAASKSLPASICHPTITSA